MDRGTRWSWLGCSSWGSRWPESCVTAVADGAEVLTRFERGAPLLPLVDLAGRFWGRVPDTGDAAGATLTVDFPRVIILSIEEEER